MESIRFFPVQVFPPTPPESVEDASPHTEYSATMSQSNSTIPSEPLPQRPPSHDNYLNYMPKPSGLDMLLFYYSELCWRPLPPHMHRQMPEYVVEAARDARAIPWIATRPAENNLILDQLLEVHYLRESMWHLYPYELQVREFEPLIMPGYPKSPLIYHMTLGLAQDNHIRIDDHIRMLFLENFYSRRVEGQHHQDHGALCVKFHEALTKTRRELLVMVSMVTMAYIWITKSGEPVYNGFYL